MSLTACSQPCSSEQDWGTSYGLPTACAANFDNLQTVPKNNIGDRIARLTMQKMKESGAATSFALGFDDE
jgi:mRNA-degrading endonuclease toxin of MazEF toxin-antitoxin module